MNTTNQTTYNIFGLRISHPFPLPFAPASNHIGSVILYNSIIRALKARGVKAAGGVSGELNSSQYIFLVDRLAASLQIIEELLTECTLRPVSTVVIYDSVDGRFCIKGPNGGRVSETQPIDLHLMQANHAGLIATLQEMKTWQVIPDPAPGQTENAA